MLTRVYSAAIQGVDAVEVEVEVNTGPGDPKVVVVEPIFTFADEKFAVENYFFRPSSSLRANRLAFFAHQ